MIRHFLSVSNFHRLSLASFCWRTKRPGNHMLVRRAGSLLKWQDERRTWRPTPQTSRDRASCPGLQSQWLGTQRVLPTARIPPDRDVDGFVIEVKGYASSFGSAALNQKL